MSERLAATDWSATPLGPRERWPQSLEVAVGICMNSRFPMFVWWGEQLINLYNDAYIPVLGQRHPAAFGQPARAFWHEIWPVVGPQAEAVMQRGEATWNERVLLEMERNGYPEHTWFTWSYSPIPDGQGGIGGVFCACTEETPRVLAERERDRLLEETESQRSRLAAVFAQSPAFVAVLRGPHYVFEFVNERYVQLVGRDDLVGRPLLQALPEVAGQGFVEILDRVCAEGEPFFGNAMSLRVRRRPGEALQEVFVDFAYQPIRTPAGAVTGVFVLGVDVSDRERAQRTLRESEANFRELADAMPQIVFSARPDGEVDYFNRQWYDYTGLPRDATGFESWRRVHTEDGLARVMAAWPAALRKGGPYEIEYPLRRHDGVYRWHLGRALPVRDAEGRIRRWFGTNTDIHDRRQALASENDVLELIAKGAELPLVLDTLLRRTEEQSQDGLLGSVLLADEAGQRLRHGAAPSLPADFVRAIDGLPIGPRSAVCGTAAHRREGVVVADVATDPLCADFRALAGRHGLRACASLPIVGTDGRLLGTVATYYRRAGPPSARDAELARSATHLPVIVIEKSRAEQRLRRSFEAEQQARSDAERAGRMKDEFLATLSHELRTPLNAILGWTLLLGRKHAMAPDVAKGVEVIERNARAQARIIDDLLEMSAIVAGKVRLEAQPLDLAECVALAVETARPAAQAKDVGLAMHPASLPTAPVTGDGARLQQVLWNLLSNAIKFTPAGGRIEVRLDTAEGGGWRVGVHDTGEGIDPAFLPQVFDRFRQADASVTRRHGGLGLGLAIVKQLVELQGGTVAASSPGLGRGACFSITLPATMNPAPAAGVGTVSSRGEARPERPGAAAPPYALDDAAGMTVLVVDDQPDARDLVQRLLEHGGAAVSTAASASEALHALRERRFDVLVSDIGMPGEDGHSLLRRLRAMAPEGGGDTPALALTAYARPEDRIEALHAGFQMHLAKPVEPAELLASVVSLARRPRGR